MGVGTTSTGAFCERCQSWGAPGCSAVKAITWITEDKAVSKRVHLLCCLGLSHGMFSLWRKAPGSVLRDKRSQCSFLPHTSLGLRCSFPSTGCCSSSRILVHTCNLHQKTYTPPPPFHLITPCSNLYLSSGKVRCKRVKGTFLKLNQN